MQYDLNTQYEYEQVDILRKTETFIKIEKACVNF